MSAERTQHRNKVRTGPLLAVGTALLLSAGIVKNYQNDLARQRQEAQPACYFPGTAAPEGIDPLTDEIAEEDELVHDDKVTVRNVEGVVVDRKNRHQVTREGSMVIRVDDTIQYDHVNPQACEDAGGYASPDEIPGRQSNE